MKEIFRFFYKKMLTDHMFYIAFSGFLLIASLILAPRYGWATWISALSLLVLLICLFLYLFKVIMMHAILAKDNDLKRGAYRMIDTALFTQEGIYAYTYRHLRNMAYNDILIASHMENIFETARPGYRGNHKVIFRAANDVIAIAVSNAEIADQILNFVATKNEHVVLENAPKQRVSVQLNELSNHQVKGRF